MTEKTEVTAIIDNKSRNRDDAAVVEIKVITKEGRITNFKLVRDRIVIGKIRSADVVIEDPRCNAIHAVIEISDSGKITLFDMASDAGVFVNGSKIVTHALKNGDRVAILDYDIQITIRFVSFEKTTFFQIPKNVPLIDIDESQARLPIFAPVSSSEIGIEVVMYWGEEILEVLHLPQKEGRVIVGDTLKDKIDFPLLLKNKGVFPIVEVINGVAKIQFPEEFSGVVKRSDGLYDIDHLKPQLAKSGDRYVMDLGVQDFVKLKVYSVSFFIQFAPIPPKLLPAGRKSSDGPFLYIVGLSAVLALLGGLLLSSVQVTRPEEIRVEEIRPQVLVMEDVLPKPPPPVKKPEPQTTIEEKVVKPKTTVPPKIKPTTVKATIATTARTTILVTKKVTPKLTTVQVAKSTVLGARPGEKTSLAQAKGGSSAGTPSAGGGQTGSPPTPGKSEVPDMGVVDLLSGGGGLLSKQLANSAGDRLSNAASQVRGNTDSGSGANTLRSGVSNVKNVVKSEKIGSGGIQGIGGGKEGNYGVEDGDIAGTKDGKATVSISEYTTDEAVVAGSLDSELIEKIIQENKDRFRYCYEKEANSSPGLAGKVTVKFVIAPSGNVSDAGVVKSSVGNSTVDACVVGVMKKLKFPEPKGGGVVTVTKGFNFRPSGT